MNSKFRKIDIENVLFFDCEVVRNQESLDINSKEFELFQKKTRDRSTDEILADEDVLTEYNRLAGLKMTYNKIACISCGIVKNNKLYIKSFTGGEKEVIEAFYKKAEEFSYVSGYNIVGYDLPMIRVNSLRHGLIDVPERFNDSGKKPWELKDVIDLMDLLKGSHFANPSLDEVCHHLGLLSPKEGDVDGSKVSEVFYRDGVERVKEYCNRDVFATVNLFLKLQGADVFTDYVDVDVIKEAPKVDVDVLTVIAKTGSISEKSEAELLNKAKALTKKEKENLIVLIKASLNKKEYSEEEDLFNKILKTRKTK